MKISDLLIALLLVLLTPCGFAVEQAVVVPPTPFSKDFGAVSPGAVLKLTVSSPCTLNGKTAGGIWAGGSVTFVPAIVFTASVPQDKGGVHVGTFSGKYKECGGVGGGGTAPVADKDWSGKATDKSGLAVLLSLNPCEDTITVVLQVAGNVKLTLTGTPNIELSNAHHGVGSFNENFHFASMPEGVFTSVDMVFTPDGGGDPVNDSLPARFQNLGMTRHSIYNVPDESDPTCQQGGKVNINVSNGPDSHDNCTSVTDEIFVKFKRSMDRNGTGKSIDNGLIGREYLCATMPEPKYRRKTAVTGSCNTPLDTSSVAADIAGGQLACGDAICIDPGGRKLRKVVRDKCPQCQDGHHIDNFTGPGGCGPAADFGNFITIKAIQ